jgi:iron-sulfur cluster assembly accessory protein
MQTATAFRPHTLPDDFPPPRNSGIPDTSIAADAPFNTEKGTEQSVNQARSSAEKSSELGSAISEREGEAQKPKPVDPSATASAQTPSTGTTKPRRPKLRPRKAAMKLMPAAVEQLRGLLSQPEPKMIRVGVKNRGCSGLAYHLEYVDKAGKFDEVVEQDGVQVLIDSKALFSIIGSEMDWQEDKLSRRFIFRNPNISELPIGSLNSFEEILML